MSACRGPPHSCSRISTSRPSRWRICQSPETKAFNEKQEGDLRRASPASRAAGRPRRHGPRHAADHAAAAAVLLHGAARHRRPGRAHGQRRPCRIRARASRTASSRSAPCRCPTATRPRRSSSVLDEARLQGRADPDQRRRQGAVRSGLRTVLEKGRGTRRPGRHPSQRIHARRTAARASTSTTSSATRSRPPSRCIT